MQIHFKQFQYQVPIPANDWETVQCKQYAALVFLRKHFKHHYELNNQQNTLKQKAKLICMQQTHMHAACMLCAAWLLL